LTGPCIYRPALPACRACFPKTRSEPSRCRPIPRSPAAIAVRPLVSPAANRTFTPAAGFPSPAAARIAGRRASRNAEADRPTTAMARPHMAAVMDRAAAASAKCSARRVPVVARRPRCRSSPAAISRSTARIASSSAAATAEVATAAVPAGAGTECTSSHATESPSTSSYVASRRALISRASCASTSASATSRLTPSCSGTKPRRPLDVERDVQKRCAVRGRNVEMRSTDDHWRGILKSFRPARR